MFEKTNVNSLLKSYNYVLYYLFKKKKKKNGLNVQFIINNFNIFKIIFFFNVYFNFEKKIDNENFFHKYYFLKNFWFIFFNLYNINQKKLRVNINLFFNLYVLKNIRKSIIFFKNKKSHIFFSLNFMKIKLQDIFKNQNNNKIIKSKNKVVINFYLKKRLNSLLTRFVKIKVPFFFFNKYKKKLLKYLVFFMTKSYKIDINKKEYVHYWTRFYTYTLKRIYIYFLYFFKKLLFFFFIIYKSFIKLLNWKKNLNKLEFAYFFFFNTKKGFFYKNFRIQSTFDHIHKLLNLNFYKKKNYRLYYFLIKKKNKLLKKIKIELFIFGKFIEFKMYQFIKNSFFLIFFYAINIWMNRFVKLFNINKHYNYIFLNLRKNIKSSEIFSKKIKKREHLIILKKNYYIYDNLKKI